MSKSTPYKSLLTRSSRSCCSGIDKGWSVAGVQLLLPPYVVVGCVEEEATGDAKAKALCMGVVPMPLP